jgi:hypothetical protein
MEENKKVEYLSFKIDGEWLTNFFRTRFWDEKCGYEKALYLIKESLGDIPEDICIALLEGRKKLVGINEFDLVDDNENIRTLSSYIKEQENKININTIANNIIAYPYNYIDMYSSTTSMRWVELQLKYHYNDTLQNGYWYNQLVFERGNPCDVLKNGCWWLEYAGYTAKVILEYSEKMSLNYTEFSDMLYKVYEDEINKLREQKIPFEELTDYQQSIICRNQRYAFSNDISWNYLGNNDYVRTKYYENVKKEKKDDKPSFKEQVFEKAIDLTYDYLSQEFSEDNEEDNEANSLSDDENITDEDLNLTRLKYNKAKEMANNPAMNSLLSKYGMGDMMEALKSDPFDITPHEPIAGWDGFIDREGKFYTTKPIGKGWYNGSANCHGDWACQYLRENNITLTLKDNIHDEKDYLIYELGWCDMSHFIILENDINITEPRMGFSKAQEETLFKLFELNNDDMKKYYDAIGVKE